MSTITIVIHNHFNLPRWRWLPRGWVDWRLNQPGFDHRFGNLACLAILVSSDRTKQICLWMTIYIYIYLKFLNEYFAYNVSLHTIKWFQFIIFFIQTCFSKDRQNVTQVDVLEQIAQTIYPEKSLSDESEFFTFYENVFNGARRLTHQTLRLLFLFQDKRVSKPCLTNAQSTWLATSDGCAWRRLLEINLKWHIDSLFSFLSIYFTDIFALYERVFLIYYDTFIY